MDILACSWKDFVDLPLGQPAVWSLIRLDFLFDSIGRFVRGAPFQK